MCLIRVVDAIITLKDQYIYMPSARERQKTSDEIVAFRGLRDLLGGLIGPIICSNVKSLGIKFSTVFKIAEYIIP